MPSFAPASLVAFFLGASGVSSVAASGGGRLLSTPAGFGQVGNALYGIPPTNSSDKTEFGTAVALSKTLGTRLAVGAPLHDYTSPTSTDPSFLNEDGGAVFLYDYDGSEWNLHWFESGTAGEQLGDRVAVSAAGDIVAVRRYLDGAPDTVEVHSITAPFTSSLVDVPITCGDDGSTFSMSADGQRIAMSCEEFGANFGRVMVYDLVGGVWTVSLTVDGNETGAFLGWGASLSADGNRLALSAPNSNTDMGYVSVYEYDVGTSLWSKMGADLPGDATDEQFGFALALSGDGSTMIVGSPKSDSQIGKVHVYEESGGVWSQVGNTILGETSLGRFGRSVAISNDGSRIAASEFFFGGQAGRIRLMEVVGGIWTDVASDIVGLDALGRLGNGIFSVSMTSDGVRIAGGAVWGQDDSGNNVGRVRVFDEGPTLAPTSAPTEPVPATTSSPSAATLAPSAATPAPTTATPAPSVATPAPTTVTSAPTAATPSPTTATPSPTSSVPQFLWDIFRVGDVSVGFDEASEASELLLNYNITLRDVVLQVFEDDCNTTVPSAVASASGTTTPTSATHGDLEVLVDLDLGGLTGSPIWTSTGNGTGYVGMCVRVDLVLNDLEQTSVNFHEQKVFITVSLLSGFEVLSIDLDRIGADEVTTDTDIDYGLTACQCDELSNCLGSPAPLTQGSDVFICVSTSAADVEIADVRELDFSQGALTVSAINDGVENALTATTITGKDAIIRHQLISAFFDDESPGNVDAVGVALLEFVEDDSRRSLRSVPVVLRALDESPSDSFELSLALASTETSGAANSMVYTLTVIMVGGVMLFA